MEYMILDPKQLTEENLIEAIKQNCKTATLMKKEIDKLEKTNKEYQLNKQNPEANFDSEILTENKNHDPSNFNEDFENEVDYYFGLLDSIILSDEMKENIEDVLPSKKKINCDKLIMRLQMELLKNIKDIEDLLEEEKELLSKEDLEEFKSEIELNRKKIEVISELKKEKQNNKKEPIENHLFFVPTTGGNIRVLEEIDDIDIDYLKTFKGLFDSIKDGTFKNVKRFNSGNTKTSGISEVKDFKTRVVFDRIGKHDYAIITAFMKKSDNDKGYKVSLELKIKNYLNMKERMVSNLENQKFRNTNQLLEQELYEKLSSQNENQVKILRKEKINDEKR